MLRTAAHCVHVLTLPDKFATPHGCCAKAAKSICYVRTDVKLQNITTFLIGADHVAKHIVQYIVGKLLTQGI